MTDPHLADFDDIYLAAGADLARIPWARLGPNPDLVAWLDATPSLGRRALVVACGLGDDAEELASRGFSVDAFDAAQTAIALCHQRFPASTVRYRVADLFALPHGWVQAFDLVVEINTLQSLPAERRRAGIRAIAGTVACGGSLFLRCIGRDPDEPAPQRPWPLTRAELAAFADEGLVEVAFRDEPAAEGRPRRFQLVAQRPLR